MGRFQTITSVDVNAPIDVVFERLVDHEAMARWPGIQSCRLVREGQPRNGLGAVRRIRALGVTLSEEVVQFDPPHRYDYSIIKGLPVTHRGTVTLAQQGPSVRVSWSVSLASRIPLVSGVVGRLLGLGLPKALAYFKAETERLGARS